MSNEREPAPCGTYTAYLRHYKLDEPVDDACREASKVYSDTRRAADRLLRKENQERFEELKAAVRPYSSVNNTYGRAMSLLRKEHRERYEELLAAERA